MSYEIIIGCFQVIIFYGETSLTTRQMLILIKVVSSVTTLFLLDNSKGRVHHWLCWLRCFINLLINIKFILIRWLRRYSRLHEYLRQIVTHRCCVYIFISLFSIISKNFVIGLSQYVSEEKPNILQYFLLQDPKYCLKRVTDLKRAQNI